MSETVIHSFNGADGGNPYASLFYDNGVFYGTTAIGGEGEAGTLFRYDLSSGILTTLHSFNGTDGASPYASVIYQSGILYGTAGEGGTNNNGTLFSYNLSTETFTTLHYFTGLGTDGAYPFCSPVYQNGILYGTTSVGGTTDNGTLFSYDLNTETLTTLYSFTGTDGSYINSSLIYQSGILYGTAVGGGINDNGTLFAYDLDSGIFSTLYFFTGIDTDGSGPFSSVIYQNGILYGTTNSGGTYTFGTLFSYDLDSGILTTLHSFSTQDANGALPYASVIYQDGILYGTTTYGGTYTNGTLFSYDLTSNSFSSLYSFVGTPTDGAILFSSVIYQNGILYGATIDGGFDGYEYGVLYSFDLHLPISNTCFPVGTPISCDQGNVSIDRINPLKHTIHNHTITAITRTISQDNYLVCFEQHALGNGCPNQRTVMSKNHKILFRGKMVEAFRFLKHFKNVRKVKYNQQILYNVLMEKHETICVNNLVCETLHPNNIVAMLHNRNFEEKEKNEIIRLMNESIHKKDRISYAEVARRIHS
jgi:uncharacterized repeat protein (TIGR03803 family)